MKKEAWDGFSALFDSQTTEFMHQHQEAVTRIVQKKQTKAGRPSAAAKKEKEKELETLELQFTTKLTTMKARFGVIVTKTMADIGMLFSKHLSGADDVMKGLQLELLDEGDRNVEVEMTSDNQLNGLQQQDAEYASELQQHTTAVSQLPTTHETISEADNLTTRAPQQNQNPCVVT